MRKPLPLSAAAAAVFLVVISSVFASADDSSAQVRNHFHRSWRYIFQNINPDTALAYSLPGDKRLTYWSVSYDNAIRILAHTQAGQVELAKRGMDYFLERTATKHDGWVINIVDASENRRAGRGIEHIRHVGPNVYLGIAALTLFRSTGEEKYFTFARERWLLIRDIQNRNEDDSNFGAVPMGPQGSDSPEDQQVGYQLKGPSWSRFYNTEHNADFVGFSKALADVDPNHRAEYMEAVRLVGTWVKTVYDPKKRLFYMGTTAQGFHDGLTDTWVEPGVMPLHPLDSSALMISAFGLDGLDQLGLEKAPDVALRIREAIDRNFKVTVTYTVPNGPRVSATGYDFVNHEERRKIIAYEEQGERGDIPVKVGVGRKPLLSDEWSSWVAFADLALAADLARQGKSRQSRSYYRRFEKNALGQGLKTAVPIEDDLLAYPYAHPIPYSLNKSVGFGWNTHHQPFALIGGLCRYLAAVGFDPLRSNNNAFQREMKFGDYPLASSATSLPEEALFTEAEQFVTKAWSFIDGQEWQKAIDMIDRMNNEHPNWVDLAKQQERLAARTDDFPLRYHRVSVEDLDEVFKKYWALYHCGTGEYIRLKSYDQLGEEDKALESMIRIIRDYPHAQAYDPSGWMWQMEESAAMEYGDLHERARDEIKNRRIERRPALVEVLKR